MKENTKKYVGIVLIVVGTVILLNGFGLINIVPKMSVITDNGNSANIVFDIKPQLATQLSSLGSGATYSWKVTVSNTGDVDWTNTHITLRLGKPGYAVITQTAQQAGVDYGSAKAIENEPGSLENIVSNWNLKVSSDGINWITPPECTSSDLVCKVRLHNGQISTYEWTLSPGQSDTIYFKMTIPTTAQEATYNLVLSLIHI